MSGKSRAYSRAVAANREQQRRLLIHHNSVDSGQHRVRSSINSQMHEMRAELTRICTRTPTLGQVLQGKVVTGTEDIPHCQPGFVYPHYVIRGDGKSKLTKMSSSSAKPVSSSKARARMKDKRHGINSAPVTQYRSPGDEPAGDLSCESFSSDEEDALNCSDREHFGSLVNSFVSSKSASAKGTFRDPGRASENSDKDGGSPQTPSSLDPMERFNAIFGPPPPYRRSLQHSVSRQSSFTARTRSPKSPQTDCTKLTHASTSSGESRKNNDIITTNPYQEMLEPEERTLQRSRKISVIARKFVSMEIKRTLHEEQATGRLSYVPQSPQQTDHLARWLLEEDDDVFLPSENNKKVHIKL